MTTEERDLVIRLATSLATAERLTRDSMPSVAALWRKHLTLAGEELKLDFILAAEERLGDVDTKLELKVEEPPT